MKSILLFLLFSFAGFSQVAIDGDTYLINGQKIRLYDADCPELSQPFGAATKLYVQKLFNSAHKVTYKAITADKYGRIVATVRIDGKDLAYHLILNGYAFINRTYCYNHNYIEAEQIARKKKLGVWKLSLTRPWTYRRYNRY